jgi:hypothetical protein
MYFLIACRGFSQKPKHVASNQTDTNVVVTDGLYFLSALHVSQRDVSDKIQPQF